MRLFDVKSLWYSLTARRTKRVVSKQRWGLETERLEHRALLSAVADLGGGVAVEEGIVEASSRAANQVYPNLNGTWNITGTGSTNATGSVVVTQPTATSTTAVFNINGLPAITANLQRTNARLRAAISVEETPGTISLKGRFNKPHDQITLKGKVFIEGQGRVKVRLAIAFNSSTTPSTFNFTATASNGGSASLQGVRTIEL